MSIREDGVRIATVINSAVTNQEYTIPSDYNIEVKDGDIAKKGSVLAKLGDTENKIFAEMDGEVYIEDNKIYLRNEERKEYPYEIPANAVMMPGIVDGMQIRAGAQLTQGSKNPHQILKVLGANATQVYLLNEIQKVYRSQGVGIADKHFEVIIRKMMNKVQVTRSGDTELLPGDLIDQLELLALNEQYISEGKDPASAAPVLLGITKAALSTDSFLSASSFQHTIKVLAGAAIEGKIDPLYGLKENVIIGKLIPAGTGFSQYKERERIGPMTDLATQGVLDVPDEELDEVDE